MASHGTARYITVQRIYAFIYVHISSTQVLTLFWCSLREQGATPPDLAYVRYYTSEGCGQRDATRLTKVVREQERRLVEGRLVMRHRTEVVEVAAILKLEHIVPLWAEAQSGERRMYYVNKYASFC